MVNNKYIFIPNIDLDLEKIKTIVLQDLNVRVPGLASHHRLIQNHKYLLELKKKYFFLSNLYNIYETDSYYTTPVHIDTGRNCALNIPISNTEESFTVFYQAPHAEIKRIEHRVYDMVESRTEEAFRFILTYPTFINTKVPHGVFQTSPGKRIVMSWSVSNDYTFEQVKLMCMS